MNKKLVSIIIPAYNSSSHLTKCLNSILSQTYKNWEVIFVDDGSIDNTANIVKDYAEEDNRILYFYKENSGVSASRNFGIKKAHGDYIYFMDSDDEISDNALEMLVELIETNDCDFVRANYYMSKESDKFYNSGASIFQGLVNNSNSKQEYLKSIINGNIPTFVWLLLLKKDFVLKINLFDENIAYMEDKVFYFEVFSKANRFYLSNEKIYYYYFSEFNHNDKEYWLHYLKNVNLVFEDLLHISKKLSLQLDDYIKLYAFLQINYIIYKLYRTSNKINYKQINSYFYQCNNNFCINIKSTKDINLYSKLCILFINHKYWRLLCFMYLVKRWMEK